MSLSKLFSSPQLSDIQTLAENVFNKFAIKRWGELPFTFELREIFSKYASPISGQSGDVFSEPKLSEALQRGHNYIQKLKQPGTTSKENMDKYFRAITLIDLLNDKKIRPYGQTAEEKLANIEKIKEESINLLFYRMVDKKMIHSEEERSLFDTITITLTTLTIATKPRTASNRQAVYTFTDLTRITSKKDPDKIYTKRQKRTLLYEKFKYGRPLMGIQGRRIIKELRKNYFTSARGRIDNTIDVIKDNFRKSEAKYHKYFRKDLLIPHIYELFSITLGLDVNTQDFIPDATLSEQSGKYNIDVDRHHPQEDKSEYTVFSMIDDQFLVALIPLMENSHFEITNTLRVGNTIKNQLAITRFWHLYELIQRPFEAGKDYNVEFLKEFRTRTANIFIDGEYQNVKLWDLEQEVIQDYVKRWIEMKETSSESVFDNNKFFAKNYPDWYFNTFKPKMDDFNRFLHQDSLCEHPDFWDWYINTYLKEDFHPFT
jgi:hypothetical protein